MSESGADGGGGAAPEESPPVPAAPSRPPVRAYNPAGARPDSNPAQESERGGHVIRSYRIAISVGALAQAWARQEQAPAGATVVSDREVSPLSRLAKLWMSPAEQTLAMAVILRPTLGVEDADAVWVLGALAAAEGAEEVSGQPISSWWPDTILDGTGRHLGIVKAEIQLGPGKVRSAVLTVRLDMAALGVAPERRDDLVDAILASSDRHLATLADGAGAVAAAYERRCTLLGQRLKVRLLPKGETRGIARGVDRLGRLELESPSGMVERLNIDVVRDYEVVG